MQTSLALKQKIRDAFERVEEEQTILFFMLSDWVYILLIPESYHYSEHETKQIAKEIQQNILPGKHPSNRFQILTWQEIIHQNQHLHPAYSGWRATHSTQVIFFAKEDSLGPASESLWLGQEIETTVKSHKAKVNQRLKLLQSLKNILPTGISWEPALESALFSRRMISEWSEPLREVDWQYLGKPVQISLRSLGFQKAWPGALIQQHRKSVWAVECAFEDSLRPIVGDSAQLFEHYWRESKRQMGVRKFDCVVYLHEDRDLFAAVLVGDQIASIAAFPELVVGAIKPFRPDIDQVRVVSFCEDSILIVDPKTPESLIKDLKHKADILVHDQSADGVDALEYDALLELPEHPCGNFAWRDIPGPYFDLVEAAGEAKSALPPGRSEYLRGLSYELIQNWPKAVEMFRVAYRYNFGDGDINHALGRALIETGQFEEAISFLEKAMRLLPDDPDIANGLGIAHLECGHQDVAIIALEKAVALSPDDAQFLSNLGRCYFSSKRFKEAESVLQKALTFSPNFSEAHATLAQIRWRLGDLPTARKHARKAFAANPGSQYTQDLLWALTVDER
ncbi:MAG: tetratricopeptide repeat protein [Myxococcota bacterium]